MRELIESYLCGCYSCTSTYCVPLVRVASNIQKRGNPLAVIEIKPAHCTCAFVHVSAKSLQQHATKNSRFDFYNLVFSLPFL